MYPMPRPIKKGPTSKRKRKYIDFKLQGFLSIALIVLETSMLVAAMIYLYFRFSHLISENMFTIHRAEQDSLFIILITELGIVIAAMAVANSLALVIAHVFWSHYVKSILVKFRHYLKNMHELNFGIKIEKKNQHHKIIRLLETWRKQEFKRMAALKNQMELLPSLDGKNITESQLADIKSNLIHSKSLLQNSYELKKAR